MLTVSNIPRHYQEFSDNSTQDAKNHVKQLRRSDAAIEHMFEIFRSSSMLEQYGTAPIVLLYGPSCVGKTSTITAMQRKCTWLASRSVDQMLVRHYCLSMEVNDPLHFRRLREYCGADDYTILFFVDTGTTSSLRPPPEPDIAEIRQKARSFLYSLVQQRSYEKMLRSMFSEICDMSIKNRPVIVDLVGKTHRSFFEQIATSLFHAPIFTCFLYCDFEKFSERIHTRNLNAILQNNLGDARLGFFQFEQLLCELEICLPPTAAPHPSIAINLSKVEESLHTYTQLQKRLFCMLRSPPDDSEQPLQEIVQKYQPLLQHQGQVVLTTKFPCDRAINTTTTLPEAIASSICGDVFE